VIDQSELRARVERILRNTPGVTGADYFGSMVTGRTDGLSDIDLIVRCEPPVSDAVVDALHADLIVALYLPFPDREPSGRYWFSTTQPFLRLDVSFHDALDYQEALLGKRRFVSPPFAAISLEGSAPAPPKVEPAPVFTETDRVFGESLLALQEAIKRAIRGGEVGPVDTWRAELDRYRADEVTPGLVDLYRRSVERWRAAGEGPR
jgi:predicted nucleotidyltransferase